MSINTQGHRATTTDFLAFDQAAARGQKHMEIYDDEAKNMVSLYLVYNDERIFARSVALRSDYAKTVLLAWQATYTLANVAMRAKFDQILGSL